MPKFSIALILVTSLSISSLLAQPNEGGKELKRFSKCYGQFVRKRVEADNPLMRAVKSGEMTGAQACMELMKKADLSQGGMLKTLKHESEGALVLKTFNDFHRSWFGSRNINSALVNAYGSSEIYDSGEAAYYVTRSLFDKSMEYQSIVTSDDYLKAVRKSEHPRSEYLLHRPNGKIDLVIGNFLRDENGKLRPIGDRLAKWHNHPPLVELGKLMGLTERSNYVIGDQVYNHNNLIKDPNSVDLFDVREAGVLGLQSFALLNFGMDRYRKSDGAAHVPRRWARAALNSLMCRDVPMIRAQDAMPYVDFESPLSFRGGISCMKCHATMDPMARVNRNMMIHTVGRGRSLRDGTPTYFMTEHQVEYGPHPNESVGWIDEPDSKFWRRPPQGKFLMRTAKGELVDEHVSNIGDLGRVMAETEDLYLCGVKRYLKFLTGIDLPLFDPGDINAPQLNATESKIYQQMQSMASDFKEHQDPKRVIEKIIRSDLYLEPTRGKGGLR